MPSINLPELYETLNQLQLEGDYEELNQIGQYAIDAIQNDKEKVTVKIKK